MSIKALVYHVEDHDLLGRIEHAMRAALGPRPDAEDWLVAVFPTQTGNGWDLAIHAKNLRVFRSLACEAVNLPSTILRVLPQMLNGKLGRTA